MKHIKNIIFDLGAVLIDIDLSKTACAFDILFKNNYTKIKQALDAEQFFQKQETNEVTENIFYKKIIQYSNSTITQEQVQDAWNALLGEIPDTRLKMLEALRPNYNLYLLSNTNSIHLNHIRAYLKKEKNISDFDAYFKKAYYSHLIGLRKPGTEIYEFVLRDAQLNPSETFFIDDNAKNIQGANAVGIQTLLHDPKNEIDQVLREKGFVF